jgi:hypothetical protein
VYVPAATLNVGVATVPVIVYAALATLLLVQPLSYAIAFSVVVAEIVTALLYTVPLVDVGVLPSVV